MVSSIDGCRVGSMLDDSLVGTGSGTKSAMDVATVVVTAGSGTEGAGRLLAGVTEVLED